MQTLDRLIESGYLDQNYLIQSAFFQNIRHTTQFLNLLEKLNKRKKQLKEQLTRANWLPKNLLNESYSWDGQLK